ncbi:MAG: hypothetical protein DME90_05495 [Verrucomicrobia bacterium]|nr:MAG: hypothetical protein DME90_05495 [Verrucomicrobiota bacterium]
MLCPPKFSEGKDKVSKVDRRIMKNSNNYVMPSTATLTQSGLLAVLLQRQRQKADRVGSTRHTPRPKTFWTAIPSRLWTKCSAAHLNLH